MGRPDKTLLDELRKRGDDGVDLLLGDLLQDHGEEALGGLLGLMFRWPHEPFPPHLPKVPAEVIAAATLFLETPGILDGAMAGVDWKRVRDAQEFYTSHQSLGLLILGCGSLPACYSIPGVAKVLIGSGKLSMQVRMRLLETSTFLTEVMTPGSLGPDAGGKGNRWIRKVRLMHGLMRCLMLADPLRFTHLNDESPSTVMLKLNWGNVSSDADFPIDQVELAFVLLTFSWMVLRGFDTLGVSMTAQQRDDHIYAWSVIGHGMGIEPSMRPVTAEDAEHLFELIREHYEEGTEEGRLLVAALVVYIIFRLRQGIREMLPPAVLRFLVKHFRRFGSACLESLARTFVRMLSGSDTANKLWVPRAPFIHWVAGGVIRLGLILRDARKSGDKGFPQMLGEQFSVHPPSR